MQKFWQSMEQLGVDPLTGQWIFTLEGIAFVLLLVAVPMFVVELWMLWSQGELTWKRGKGMATSAFCALPAWLVQVAGTGAVLLLFFGMYESVSWRVPLTTGTALLCLLLVDFLYYWEHRVGHEVNLCWAMYHSVHHSAQHYDQSIGLRISFADFFVSPLFFLPLVLFGFHPLLVFACLGVVLGWQQWIHTEMVPKLLWLDRWLNTPSNHRVHHGSNPEYLDKNYGGILIVWDRLFGTYEVEKETVVYGLVEPLESHHPLDVHIHVFRKLMKKARETHSWSELARLLFRNPPF